MVTPVIELYTEVLPLAVDCAFVRTDCYFPTSIGVNEELGAKWVFVNQGDPGRCAWALGYKGEVRAVWPVDLATGQTVQLTTKEGVTIEDLLGEKIAKTQTLQLTFYVGEVVEETEEIIRIRVTDEWGVAVYVEVLTAGLPWVLILGGVGILALGVGLVLKR